MSTATAANPSAHHSARRRRTPDAGVIVGPPTSCRAVRGVRVLAAIPEVGPPLELAGDRAYSRTAATACAVVGPSICRYGYFFRPHLLSRYSAIVLSTSTPYLVSGT